MGQPYLLNEDGHFVGQTADYEYAEGWARARKGRTVTQFTEVETQVFPIPYSRLAGGVSGKR